MSQLVTICRCCVSDGVPRRSFIVALVVMRHGLAAAWFDRQPWLGAVERLDLALFVEREHHGMRWWIEIETDNVGEFGRKTGVARALEGAQAMRLQVVRPPDALH